MGEYTEQNPGRWKNIVCGGLFECLGGGAFSFCSLRCVIRYCLLHAIFSLRTAPIYTHTTSVTSSFCYISVHLFIVHCSAGFYYYSTLLYFVASPAHTYAASPLYLCPTTCGRTCTLPGTPWWQAACLPTFLPSVLPALCSTTGLACSMEFSLPRSLTYIPLPTSGTFSVLSTLLNGRDYLFSYALLCGSVRFCSPALNISFFVTDYDDWCSPQTIMTD